MRLWQCLCCTDKKEKRESNRTPFLSLKPMTHGWNLWCQQDVWLGAVLYVASARAMSFYTQRSPFYIAVLRVMKQNIITGPGTVHHCPIDSQWTLMWQGRTSSHGCRKGGKGVFSWKHPANFSNSLLVFSFSLLQSIWADFQTVMQTWISKSYLLYPDSQHIDRMHGWMI